MKPKVKKYLIVGGIGLITIVGAYAYWQFLKIKDSLIKFKKIAFKSIAINNIDFNMYLYLENTSSIKYTIVSQEYSVYVNDVFVTKVVNYAPNEIKPKSTNDIAVNISFDPSKVAEKLKGFAGDFILHRERIRLKVDSTLKVSIYGIKLSVPYLYETTLKELLTKKEE